MTRARGATGDQSKGATGDQSEMGIKVTRARGQQVTRARGSNSIIHPSDAHDAIAMKIVLVLVNLNPEMSMRCNTKHRNVNALLI